MSVSLGCGRPLDWPAGWSRHHWAVRTPCLYSRTSHFRSALASCLSDWRVKKWSRSRSPRCLPHLFENRPNIDMFWLGGSGDTWCQMKFHPSARNEAAQSFLAAKAKYIDRASRGLEMMSWILAQATSNGGRGMVSISVWPLMLVKSDEMKQQRKAKLAKAC